ncbi:hypothetical protein ARMSODRAFT_617287 [Armillaria solidipes]|uniref:Uncharacterized protein n=1 Tax=Armillaria solidipes TaxID=1076256 RepID=A0A2H3AT33_9AGAR|nr:hypothetical protein ARMSODRAFT_617287 [Armillaria solidipes]
MLPSNIEHLSLISYPEPFILFWAPESEIPVEIVPCSAITTILNSGSFGSLINLNISYRWESDCTEVFFLGLIPQVLPYLEFLGLNRYGRKDSPFGVASSLEKSLQNLRYLSHLRLNLDKSEGHRHDLFKRRMQQNKPATMMQAMRQVALSISSLQFILWLDLIFPNVARSPLWLWHRWKILRTDGNVELQAAGTEEVDPLLHE